MKADHNPIVRDIVTRASLQLFEAYGVTLVPISPEEPSTALALCGVIGFTGDVLRGSLVMAVTTDVLKASYPVDAPPGRDWMAELANQLLGRVKNQLLPWGAIIHLSTPVVLRGEHISPVSASLDMGAQTFRASCGEVYVWVEAELTEGEALLDQPAQDDTAEEGSAMLF